MSSALKHGGNKATFAIKRQAKRDAEKQQSRDKHKKLKQIALDNPSNPKLRRDPGVPDLANLHAALDRRAVSMDTDRKFQRQQEYAKKRLAIMEAKKANGGKVQTSETGGKLTAKQSGMRDVINDAKEIASRRQYWSEMLKVIDASDILLEVLDARDPAGCRCREVERMIQSKMDRSGASPKRIILVMNKIDLVTHENLQGWMKAMRREFPTIAFKANTQQQSANLKQHTHVTKGAEVDEKTLQRSGTVGSQALLQLLKNYSRSLNIKKQITVGIIGYPNVGKSSLINSLTRARRAAVGNMPGLTKSLQTVKLDHQINLIDSPGVMFSGGRAADGSDDADLLLRNCIRFEQLEDPIGAVYKVVERCTMEQLQSCYDLGGVDFEDADQFLFLVAQKRGKLLKGGVPDLDTTAKIILKDWNDGKIEYMTDPPTFAADRQGEADVVSEWSQEFDVEQLLSQPLVEVEDEEAPKRAEQRLALAQPEKVGVREVLHEEEMTTAGEQQQPAKPIVPGPKPSSSSSGGGDGEERMDGTGTAAAPALPLTAAGLKRQKKKMRRNANLNAAAEEGEEEDEEGMEEGEEDEEGDYME